MLNKPSIFRIDLTWYIQYLFILLDSKLNLIKIILLLDQERSILRIKDLFNISPYKLNQGE